MVLTEGNEGYAVSINPGKTESDREIVAVFRYKMSAVVYVKEAYGENDPRKPEIKHVFFGVEAF